MGVGGAENLDSPNGEGAMQMSAFYWALAAPRPLSGNEPDFPRKPERGRRQLWKLHPGAERGLLVERSERSRKANVTTDKGLLSNIERCLRWALSP